MKNLLNTLKVFVLVTIVLFSTSSFSFAKSKRAEQRRIVSLARQAVVKANPSDWLTLAASANACIDKKVNLDEAKMWIDQSLAIKQTSFNLQVAAEFYKATNDTEKAIEFYLKSMSRKYLDN